MEKHNFCPYCGSELIEEICTSSIFCYMKNEDENTKISSSNNVNDSENNNLNIIKKVRK
ncbi:MAG: hypothetical protein WCO13_06225 [Bacteroidota bacterium]